MSNDSNIQRASIVYRYPYSPHTVYLNITNRCTNSCSFCIKNYSSGLSGYILRLDREPTFEEVWSAFQREIKRIDEEVVWCGFGEPTIRLEMVLNLTRRIRKEYPFLKVRLNTDGLAQLRNKDREVARELKESGMDSVSISLIAESKEKYDEFCKPSISGAHQAVLDFARDCKKYFSEVRLTIVNLMGIDVTECRRIAEELGCDFKVRS